MYARSVAASEAVPVEFEYANPSEATSDFEAPVHKNDQVGTKPTTVEPGRQLSPGMAKTKLKANSVVSPQGRGQAVGFAPNPQPGASVVVVREKPKFGTEMASPLKVAVGQTTGARKVESHPHGLTQEETHQEKAKPAPRNAPRKDQSREAKEEGEDINTRVSAFIDRAKIRMSTMSNAGGTKGAGQKDSGSDHIENFIQQTKMKIRTMSGIGGGGGGGKNAQSK